MDVLQDTADQVADELRGVGVNVVRVYKVWAGPDSDELDPDTGERLKLALCEGPALELFTAVYRPAPKGRAPTIFTRPGWAIGCAP